MANTTYTTIKFAIAAVRSLHKCNLALALIGKPVPGADTGAASRCHENMIYRAQRLTNMLDQTALNELDAARRALKKSEQPQTDMQLERQETTTRYDAAKSILTLSVIRPSDGKACTCIFGSTSMIPNPRQRLQVIMSPTHAGCRDSSCNTAFVQP
jgi:hypothetical protein